MSLFWEILLLTIGAAIYFNIGWFLGAYYYEKVTYELQDEKKIPEPFLKKFLSGPLYLLAGMDKIDGRSKLIKEITFSILWSAVISMLIVSWFIYVIWIILKVVVLGAYLLFKLVFAGGISRLIWPKLAGTKVCN